MAENIPSTQVNTNIKEQNMPSKELWQNLVNDDMYGKSYEEFEKEYSTKDKVDELHTKLSNDELYTNSQEDFYNDYFPNLKKKETLYTESTNGGSEIPQSESLSISTSPKEIDITETKTELKPTTNDLASPTSKDSEEQPLLPIPPGSKPPKKSVISAIKDNDDLNVKKLFALTPQEAEGYQKEIDDNNVFLEGLQIDSKKSSEIKKELERIPTSYLNSIYQVDDDGTEHNMKEYLSNARENNYPFYKMFLANLKVQDMLEFDKDASKNKIQDYYTSNNLNVLTSSPGQESYTIVNESEYVRAEAKRLKDIVKRNGADASQASQDLIRLQQNPIDYFKGNDAALKDIQKIKQETPTTQKKVGLYIPTTQTQVVDILQNIDDYTTKTSGTIINSTRNGGTSQTEALSTLADGSSEFVREFVDPSSASEYILRKISNRVYTGGTNGILQYKPGMFVENPVPPNETNNDITNPYQQFIEKKEGNINEDTNLNNYSLESIRQKLDPNSLIDKLAFDIYAHKVGIDDAIMEASANPRYADKISDAAINYGISIDPQLKKQYEALGNKLPEDVVARLKMDFMNDPYVQSIMNDPAQRFRVKQEYKERTGQDIDNSIFNQQLLAKGKTDFIKDFKSFAIKDIATKISNERQARGMGDVFLDIPTKIETDELVNDMVAKGQLTPEEGEVYKSDIRQDINVFYSAASALTSPIGGGTIFLKNPIKTNDLLGQAQQGWGEGLINVDKSILNWIGTGIEMSTPGIQTYGADNILSKEHALARMMSDAVVTKFVPNESKAVWGNMGHTTGFLGFLIAGGSALKTLGIAESTAHMLSTASTFYSTNYEKALEQFPGNDMKDMIMRTASTNIHTAVDVFFIKALPKVKLSAQTRDVLTADINTTLQQLKSGVITATEATGKIQNRLLDAAKNVAGASIKTTNVMTALASTQTAIGSFLGENNKDISDIVNEAVDGYLPTMLSTAIISTYTGIMQKGAKMNGKDITDLARNYDYFSDRLDKMVEENPSSKKEVDDMRSNLEAIRNAYNSVQDEAFRDLTPEQKEKYIALSLYESANMNKATSTSDVAASKKFADKANEIRQHKSEILNNKDKAPEHKEYTITLPKNEFDDTENKPGISSEVREGETIEPAKSDERTGAEATSTSGVFQTQGTEAEGARAGEEVNEVQAVANNFQNAIKDAENKLKENPNDETALNDLENAKLELKKFNDDPVKYFEDQKAQTLADLNKALESGTPKEELNIEQTTQAYDKLIEQAKDYGKQKVETPVTEVTKEEVPKQEVPKFHQQVDEVAAMIKKALMIKPAKEGQVIQKAGVDAESVIDFAADMVKKAYDAKVSIKESVEKAIEYIKNNWDEKWGKLDEDQVREKLNKLAELPQQKGTEEAKLEDIGGGQEPPKQEETGDIYEEERSLQFKHRGLQEVATEFGLEDIAPRERKSDMRLFKDAENTIDSWMGEGTYEKNVSKIIETAENKKPLSDEENVILSQHISNLRAEMKNMDVNSPEYDVKLKELQRVIKAGEATRSAQGAALRVPTISTTARYDLPVMLAQKMEALNVEELTPTQKAEVVKQYEDIQAKLKIAEEKNKVLEAKIAEYKAQQEVDNMAGGGGNKPKKPKTAEEFKAERKSLKDKLAQQFKDYKAAGQKMGLASDGGAESFIISAKMAKTIIEIGKSYVDELGNNLKEITAKTFEDIKDIFEGINITEKDIHDVFAGKYTPKKKTKSQLQNDWKDLADEAKLINELERLMSGDESKLTEKQKVERNQKIKDLKDKIKSYKEESGIAEKERIAKAEETALINIIKLEEKIGKNEIEFDKVEKPTSAQLEEYRAEQKKLRKQLENMRKEAKVGRYSDEAKLKSAEEQALKNINELEEKIDNNDIEFDNIEKPTSTQLEEYRAKQKELRKKLEDMRREAKVGRYSDQAKLSSAEKTALENIQKLEDKLASNDLSFEKIDNPTSQQLEQYRDKQKQLRKELEKRRKEAKVGRYSDASRIASAEKAALENIQELEDKIANNDLEFDNVDKPTSDQLKQYRDKQKQLRKELEQKRKEAKVGRYSDQVRIRLAEENLEDSIKKLESDIAQNKLEVEQAEKLNSPKLEQLRQRQKELLKEREEKRKEQKVGRYSDLSRLKALKEANLKAAQRIKDKIAKGDFEPEKKTSLMEDLNLPKRFPKEYQEAMDAIREKEEAQYEYEKAKMEDEMSRRPKILKWTVDPVKMAINTITALKAGVDNSFAFVQAGLTILNPLNIKSTVKAFKEQTLDFFSQARFERELTNLHNNKPLWSLIEKVKLDILDPRELSESKKDEVFGKKSFLNVPIKIGGKTIVIGKYTTAPFERLYTSMGNNLRLNLFLNRVAELEAEGKTPETHLKEYQDAARTINEMTGRGKLHKGVSKSTEAISTVVWSPRMLASSLNILGLGDLVNMANKPGEKGYYSSLEGSKVNLKSIEGIKGSAKDFYNSPKGYALRQTIGGFSGALSLMYLWSLNPDKEVDLDPQSVSFGTVRDKKSGNSYNVLGRYTSIIRLVSMLLTGEKKSGARTTELDESRGYGSKRLEEVYRFTRGKFNPAAGEVTDFVLQRTYDGKPYVVTGSGERLLVPMSVMEIVKGLEQQGWGSILKRGVPSFYGIKVTNEADFANPLYSAEEINSSKDLSTLIGGQIYIPALKKIDEIEIDKDKNHPEGRMTESEYKEYVAFKKERFKEKIKEILNSDWEGTNVKTNEVVKSTAEGLNQIMTDKNGIIITKLQDVIDQANKKIDSEFFEKKGIKKPLTEEIKWKPTKGEIFSPEQKKEEYLITYQKEGIKIPSLKVKSEIEIDKNDNHPNGEMTDEEYEIFREKLAKRYGQELRTVLYSWYETPMVNKYGEEIGVKGSIGKNLYKEKIVENGKETNALQQIVDNKYNQVIKEILEEMKLKKPKVTKAWTTED